jgi:L-serine dehydratase
VTFISVFNDVLGPVMPGPSSSHTAGSYHLGRLARALLGETPQRALLTFDPRGSYARVYREQGVDLGFAAGLMAWPLTDRRFPEGLKAASRCGLKLTFRVAPLSRADHPNFATIDLETRDGGRLRLEGRSVGGGAVEITRLGRWPVSLDGKAYDYLLEVEAAARLPVKRFFGGNAGFGRMWRAVDSGALSLFQIKRAAPLPSPLLQRLKALSGVRSVRASSPVFFVQKGAPLFASAQDILRLAVRNRLSLGQTGLAYEAQILGLSEPQALSEMGRRFDVMRASLRRGLAGRGLRMRLLAPSAAKVLRAEREGRVAVGGLATRAAARALAIMHVSNSGGTVCAAPTGGAAGALPAAVISLAEDRRLSRDRVLLALFAASAVGVVIARRATFAAETAGCQVEIGAAGAMAAAAVVDIAGGSAAQACGAAAVSFQNTMGSVCDLVQGLCEIPCHTRNAAAAASAFVCADLIMGGYRNPVPLDETIDAVLSSGRMLPPELRCTARGGLALAPSARALGRKRLRAKHPASAG